MTATGPNYFDRDGWNQSVIKHGLPPSGTMAHVRAALLDDKEQTRPMRIGSLVHAGVFEPMTMLDDYAVMPAYENDVDNCKADGFSVPASPRSTKYYRERKAVWQAANHDKQHVTQSEYDAIKIMMANLRGHERAMRYFSAGSGEVELSATHPGTGLLLKSKLDWVNRDERYIVDLKTTRDLSNTGRLIASWLIDFQLAFYRRLLLLMTGDTYDCRLVLVMNQPPYLVDAGQVCDIAIDAMDAQIDPLLERVAEAEQSGCWPGLDDTGDKVFTVPSYHLPQQTEQSKATVDGQPVSFGAEATDQIVF